MRSIDELNARFHRRILAVTSLIPGQHNYQWVNNKKSDISLLSHQDVLAVRQLVLNKYPVYTRSD